MNSAFPVVLNLYDLSNGLAKNMSKMIIGKQIDGIWHTGIVVYGIEYYYGGGICSGAPSQTPYGRPVQQIPLGNTELPQEVFLDFLNDIAPRFAPAKYDLFKNNCNNFCDECSQFLIGTGIPKHIVNLPNEVLNTPIGRNLLGMMGGQGGNIMDPRAYEGAHNSQQMHLNYGAGGQELPNFGGGQSGNAPTGASNYQVKPPTATNDSSSGGVKPVTELMSQQDYAREIQANTAVVIDVFTEWCGPCKAIKPFFAGLPNQYPQIRFFKMDLEKNRFLGTNLGIQSIPTFLFIHKGQVVKKMSGADQSGLVSNIKWLISTYNLGSGTTAASTLNAPMAPAQPKTLQLYSDKCTPQLFDAEKWELPIKKFKEFGTKKGLFANPAFKDVESHLVANFNSVEAEGKKHVVEFGLKNTPADDADNLVPFLDFFRICFLKEDLAK